MLKNIKIGQKVQLNKEISTPIPQRLYGVKLEHQYGYIERICNSNNNIEYFVVKLKNFNEILILNKNEFRII